MPKAILSNSQLSSKKLYVRMYYSWPFRLMVFGILIGTLSLGGLILSRSKDSKAAPVTISCAKEISGGSIASALSSISPGAMLCLNGGSYTENLIVNKTINISSKDPNNKAYIHGQIEFKPGSDGSRLQYLRLQGGAQAQAGILINSSNVVIESNDITNPGTRGICVNIGTNLPPTYVYQVSGVLINGNKIHNCGDGVLDQGVYVAYTKSSPVTYITNNYIYDGPDFGIQFYPSSLGVIFEHNVVDGNKRGITFSGETRSPQSSNNIARYNIVTYNNGLGSNIESWWGGAVGSGNQAYDNCLASSTGQNINTGNGGFTVSNNKIVTDPMYTNRSGKDFSLKSGSPCAGYGPVSSSTGGGSSSGSTSTGGGSSSGGSGTANNTTSSGGGSAGSTSTSASTSGSGAQTGNNTSGNSSNSSNSSTINNAGSESSGESSGIPIGEGENLGPEGEGIPNYLAEKANLEDLSSTSNAIKSSAFLKFLLAYFGIQTLIVLGKYIFF